jgi:transcriptional regulator with XRE-family HTH domain
MSSGRELRERRVLARIPGRVICERAGVGRARLSEIECGHVRATPDELGRIARALEELIEARAKVEQFAADCGCPLQML